MLKALRLQRDGLASWPNGDKGAHWHRLTFLVERCSLTATLKRELSMGTALSANWLTVRDWDSQRRFPGQAYVTEREARDILAAADHPTDGVMRWLLHLYHRP